MSEWGPQMGEGTMTEEFSEPGKQGQRSGNQTPARSTIEVLDVAPDWEVDE